LLVVLAFGLTMANTFREPTDRLNFFTPIGFSWAALVVGKNLGWPAWEQASLTLAVFFGCFGLQLRPDPKKS
jgi:hypothetical protein